MKLSDLKDGPYGRPGYARPDDQHEFVLGPGKDLSRGCSFREVRQQDQWQLATMTYRRGNQLIVSDERGKDNSIRTWSVTPTNDVPGRGVVLKPLNEDETFFRGTTAHAVSPLILASGLKPIVAHLSVQDTFNRVSVTSSTGKGWGDVSRWISLFHIMSFVEPTDKPTSYAVDSPEVLSLKSEKDRQYGPGNKMNYRKTGRWDTVFVPQWDEYIKSGLKNIECRPDL